jgi:hypothetical protein
MKFSQITVLVVALTFSQVVFAQQRSSSIHSIDFTNFSYPSKAANLTFSSKTAKGNVFKLRQGELPPKFGERNRLLNVWLKFGSVVYGDLTGDGNEEAIVNLNWITGGSALPNLVYIYTLRKGRPTLLWAFETGDRADGGLKDVYAENGELVLELYGKGKIIGRNLYADDGTKNGDCCPTFFTRTQYVWRGGHFRQKGNAVVFPLSK